MGKNRLEAFSDGVLAILITIMVLELKVPQGDAFAALAALLPTFVSYALSFIYLAIYWNNHHHLLHAVKKVNGPILWANTHLLFWLSLVPFTTAWMGENHFTTWPVFLYAVNLLASAVAYTIMTIVAVRTHGPDSDIAKAVGRDRKGNISLFFYVISIPLTFFSPMAACACFAIVALIWLVPDRRIERVVLK